MIILIDDELIHYLWKYEAGFKNIYIATVYERLDIPSWVKAVFGKGWLGEK